MKTISKLSCFNGKFVCLSKVNQIINLETNIITKLQN